MQCFQSFQLCGVLSLTFPRLPRQCLPLAAMRRVPGRFHPHCRLALPSFLQLAQLIHEHVFLSLRNPPKDRRESDSSWCIRAHIRLISLLTAGTTGAGGTADAAFGGLAFHAASFSSKIRNLSLAARSSADMFLR